VKTATGSLDQHIHQEVTTLATLWKATRKDGAVYGFTDHDVDIVYNAIRYLASSGFNKMNMNDKAQLDISNMQIDGILSSDLITDNDIRARLWDDAQLEIRVVNWRDLTMLDIQLGAGSWGPVTINENGYSVEFKGLSDRLTRNEGDVYQPHCRVDLGSIPCGVQIDLYRVAGTVSAFGDGFRTFGFTGSITDFYDGGLVTFLGGNNAGSSEEIQHVDIVAGTITLFERMPLRIQVGDSFQAEPGCDKLFSTCKDKFNNAVNFRGEFDVPGPDHLLMYPDFKSPHS
jgi:uncharacterized phage protein (TIGR02218 family)